MLGSVRIRPPPVRFGVPPSSGFESFSLMRFGSVLSLMRFGSVILKRFGSDTPWLECLRLRLVSISSVRVLLSIRFGIWYPCSPFFHFSPPCSFRSHATPLRSDQAFLVTSSRHAPESTTPRSGSDMSDPIPYPIRSPTRSDPVRYPAVFCNFPATVYTPLDGVFDQSNYLNQSQSIPKSHSNI